MDRSGSRTEQIDRALDSLKAQTRALRAAQKTSGPRSLKRFLRTLTAGALLLLLPLPLLVKVAVWLYLEWSAGPWVALGVAAFVGTAALTAATMFISYRLTRRFVPTGVTIRSLGLLVGAFCVYSLLFISAANVKSSDVAATYRSLHPLLRMGVATLVVLDGELVVTDAARLPEDYGAMGLNVNESSLHFGQRTGYVHAVDLRTTGRPSWRNVLVAGYFRLMGFRTLRHVGTADHLHVSLPVR